MNKYILPFRQRNVFSLTPTALNIYDEQFISSTEVDFSSPSQFEAKTHLNFGQLNNINNERGDNALCLSPDTLYKTISTPKKWKQKPRNSMSPVSDKYRIEQLEAELNDLRDFKNLEQLVEKDGDVGDLQQPEVKLREELKTALEQLEEYRKKHQQLLEHTAGLDDANVSKCNNDVK